MTTTYTINFTDLTSDRSFQIRPFVTNGPETPNDTVLVDAGTSLLLFGKGAANYGEGMAENLVHLLENFSSAIEPGYPISGQLWYDRSGVEFADGQLFVFNPLKHPITSITTGASTSLIEIEGDHTARFGAAITMRLTDQSAAEKTTLLFPQAVPAVTFNGTHTEITVKPAITGPIANKYIGGWESVAEKYLLLDGSAVMTGDLDTDGNEVIGLPAVPSGDTAAASKKYVDDQVTIAAGGLFVNESGDTMTGNLVMSGAGVHVILPNAPTIGTHAANKAYVDSTLVTDHGGLTGLLDNDHPQYLRKAGDTMTGTLTLTGAGVQVVLPNAPTATTHATRKSYVDTADNALQDQIIISGTFVGDTLTLNQDGGGSVVVSGISTAGGDTLNQTQVSNPPFQQGVDGDQIHESWYLFPLFPNVRLSDIVQTFSEITWLTRQKNERTVQLATGSPPDVTYTIQPYVVGFNQLQVFVNGVKYVGNTRGFQRIFHDPSGGSAAAMQNQGGYHYGISTGLADDATVYSMTVTVDGGAPIPVSVTGSSAQNFSDLLDEINSDLGSAATAVLEEETIIIYSSTGGSSSSISIVDTDLVSSLVGEEPTGSPIPVWDTITTFNQGDVVQFTGSPGAGIYVAVRESTNFEPSTQPDYWRLVLAYNSTIDSAVGGTTYGFEEDGSYGTISTSITFTAGPNAGATIETTTLGQQQAYGR